MNASSPPPSLSYSAPRRVEAGSIGIPYETHPTEERWFAPNQQNDLSNPVAIAITTYDPDDESRFARLADASATISAPNALAFAEAILESATGGVIITTLDGNIVTFNQRFAALWNVQQGWHQLGLEQRLVDFAEKTQDPARFVERIQALLGDPAREAYDLIPLTNGRTLERYSQPFHVARRLIGRLWSYRDVSERIAMAQAVQASEQRFRSLFECSPDAIFVETPDGQIVDANPAASKLHHLSRDEMIGQNVFADGFIPTDICDVARADFARLAAGEISRIEGVSQSHDGRVIPVELRGSRIDYNGVDALLLHVRDISAHKAAEAALQRRDALLEAISATAEHFLASGELKEHLPRMLAKLGATISANRICLVQQYNAAAEALGADLCYEWHMPGIVPIFGESCRPQSPQTPIGFTRWDRELIQNRIIVGRVADLPASERLALEAQQVGSLLVIPIWEGWRWWGFMRIDDSVPERIWLNEEIEALKIAARMIGAAIRRYAIENEFLHLNATLEQQVLQRTADLEHANQKLAQSLIDRMSAYAHLADSDAHRRALIEAMPDSMLLFRVSGEVLEWQANDRNIPYPQLDRQTQLRQTDEEAAEVIARYQAAIKHVAAKGGSQIFEYSLRHQRQVRWYEARLVLVDEDRVLALIRDITSHKHAEERLQHLALHDALTGLPNRTLLFDRLRHSMQHADRDRSHAAALLLLDVDDFKRINDAFGHAIGDQLLVAIARRLKTSLRAVDTIARLGGDEFAIVLEGDARLHTTGIRLAIERIQRALAEPFELNELRTVISISAGIAVYSDWHHQPADILRDADIALYQAKARGKGLHAIFDTVMHAQVAAQVALEADLRRALEQNEFRVYYQPVINLETGLIGGFEALVRWQHPTRGLLMPDAFLPLAARIGLDVAIDRWVLAEAIRQLHDWQTPHAVRMSVNLSNSHLEHPELVSFVAQILQKSGVEPSRVMLEVTENSLIADDIRALQVLRQLQQLGVKIGLDDFGTGYSSLSYLHRFPVDVLKIDRTFLQQDAQGRNQLIMQTLVQLAQTMGLEVIAEGAETEDHIDQLTALACTYVQGYFYAPALAPEAAATFLQR